MSVRFVKTILRFLWLLLMSVQSMAASIPKVPLFVPPSLGGNLGGGFGGETDAGIQPSPADASPEEHLYHRQALQAARAAMGVAFSVFGSWREIPLMLPPSLLDPSRTPLFSACLIFSSKLVVVCKIFWCSVTSILTICLWVCLLK